VLCNFSINGNRLLTIIDGGMDQAFPPMRSHAPSSGPPAFSHAISSSPALYQSRPAAPPARRPDGPPVTSAESSYSSGFPRISSPYGAAPSSEYSMASSQTIPSISGLTQGPLTSPPLTHHSSGMMGQFNQSIPRYVKRWKVTKLPSHSANNTQITNSIRRRHVQPAHGQRTTRKPIVHLKPKPKLPKSHIRRRCW
jgi:hypothetical protein